MDICIATFFFLQPPPYSKHYAKASVEAPQIQQDGWGEQSGRDGSKDEDTEDWEKEKHKQSW